MNTVYKRLFLIIISTALLFAGCNSYQSISYDILTFKGAGWATNFSNSYYMFGTSTISKENPEVKLAAAPGDLLYLTDEEGDRPFYYRYEGGDIKSFNIVYSEKSVLVNDMTYYYLLDSDSASWTEFANTDPETIRQLKYMYLNGALTDFQLAILEKFQEYFSSPGLLMESVDSTVLFTRLINIMKPCWLVMQDTYPGPSGEDLTESLSGLKLLWGEAEAIFKANLLDFCPYLEQLIVSDYQEQYALSFEKLSRLKLLSLDESGIRDFSGILFPSDLSRLQVIMNDSVLDISNLKKIRKLNGLSLSGSEITDITFLNNLHQLQFLSLPVNITQKEFDLVMQDQRAIEVLEFNTCDSVHDLSILKDHFRLKAISINQSVADLSPLYGLTELELIVLSENLWENQEDLEALKSALPDTDIFPGNALCLGSGWILLIIPFLFIIRFRYYLIKNRK